MISGLFLSDRNACELEQASKDFNAQAYYVHLHSNKQSLFILESGKLEFLEKSKNEFVEWLILPEKVEVLYSFMIENLIF